MANEISKREPNTVHTVNGFMDAGEMRPVEITKTWNLGTGEIMLVQQGLDALTGQAKEQMAYLAWVLGSHEGVEITITHKWEA